MKSNSNKTLDAEVANVLIKVLHVVEPPFICGRFLRIVLVIGSLGNPIIKSSNHQSWLLCTTVAWIYSPLIVFICEY